MPTPTFYANDIRLNFLPLDEVLEEDKYELVAHLLRHPPEMPMDNYCTHCYIELFIRDDDQEGLNLLEDWERESSQEYDDLSE